MPPAQVVRFGLVGFGRWGKVYLQTLLSLPDRCRLTHLCTSKPENAALVSHPVAISASWRDLVRSDCDAVIIATPPQAHAEILEACLEAGKPCIVEKPFCLDVATAERLHQRIQASGIPVLVDHTHLFDPYYWSLRQALNEANEPIRVMLSEGMGFGPFRPETPALWDWGPHDLSLCLDLVGELPQQIDALAGPRNPQGAPEMISLRLDFPGGACAWVQNGCLSPQKRRSFSVMTDHRLYVWDEHAPEPLTVSRMDFIGRYAERIPTSLQRTPMIPASGLPPLANAVTYFLDGLAGGDQRYFGGELALEVTRVLAKCERVIKDVVSIEGKLRAIGSSCSGR